MSFPRIKLLILLFILCACSRAAEAETLSLQLVQKFDRLWDAGDAAGMYAFLDVDCVYKTPFRTEIGRDAVRDHVFRNFSRFRDNVSTETFSKIEENMVYSIGVNTFNEYDATGAIKSKWVSRYLNIFTRRPGEDWKLRFHVVHEDSGHGNKPDGAKKRPD